MEGQQFSMSQRLLGGFGTNLIFLLTTLIPFVYMFLASNKKKLANITSNKDVFIVFLIFLVSLVNPFNPSKIATAIAIFTFLQVYMVFVYLLNRLSKEDIVRGLYDGFFICICIQSFCTLLYPVLGIETINRFIASENAMEWSLRRDSFSAIGTFGHPGVLAIFSVFSFSIFYSSCLISFHRRKSQIGCFLSLFCLIFTQSRTSLIALGLVFVLIFLAHKYGTKILSVRNLIISVVLIIAISVLAVQIPFIYSMFFESDMNEQMDNRFIHYALGYEIFKEHPLLGVGINSHVQYMQSTSSLYSIINMFSSLYTDFFTESPIHNFHIIILAETGFFGFILWIGYFFKTIVTYLRIEKTNMYNEWLCYSFVGILCAFFIYGMLGWSGCNYYIYYMPVLAFLTIKKIKNERIISMRHPTHR